MEGVRILHGRKEHRRYNVYGGKGIPTLKKYRVIKRKRQEVYDISPGSPCQYQRQAAIFDYGACIYLESVNGDTMLYFNGKDIVKVIGRGYSDEEDLMQENLLWSSIFVILEVKKYLLPYYDGIVPDKVYGNH